MKNNKTLYVVVGFVLGALLTFLVTSKSEPAMNTGSHVMPDGSMMHDSMSMQGMVDALKGKQGDEFDKEFIQLMIEHHQGAIDMAHQALENAGHEELKTLADDIITTQTKEIEMMDEWSRLWGYKPQQ